MFCCTDDGSEGQDSCVRLPSTAYVWFYGMADPCQSNTHSLTLKGSVPTTKLFAFANGLASGAEYWVGGFQVRSMYVCNTAYMYVCVNVCMCVCKCCMYVCMFGAIITVLLLFLGFAVFHGIES